MAFLFPANPADGDIVVRGDLLATYYADTDTWTVGQLNPVAGIPGPTGPQGPQGEQGPQGVGFEVDGSVADFASLPAANLVNPNDIYVTLDTGHGWIWTGTAWVDLGVILQGPQGETGRQGNQGIEGPRGPQGPKGDQGLQGSTGPEGPVAQMPIASPTVIGGIKIGRGLDIRPDGTANAGETTVRIETVPIPAGDDNGETWSETRPFRPIYLDIGAFRDQGINEPTYIGDWDVVTASVPMPPKANGCMIWWWTSSSLTPKADRPVHPSQVCAYYAYIEQKIYLRSGGSFSSNSGFTGTTFCHNLALNYLAVDNRVASAPRTKFDEILFEPGSELNFEQIITIQNAAWCRISAGFTRMILQPFIDRTGQILDPDYPTEETYNASQLTIAERIARRHAVMGTVPYGDDFTSLPPPSQKELNDQASAELKVAIAGTISEIDSYKLTDEADPSVVAALEAYRLELINIRNLPGTVSAISDEANRVLILCRDLMDYQFRFEVD